MTYSYKTLKEFKKEYVKEAEQSIIVPEYSTNKDFDRQVADLMKCSEMKNEKIFSKKLWGTF